MTMLHSACCTTIDSTVEVLMLYQTWILAKHSNIVEIDIDVIMTT